MGGGDFRGKDMRVAFEVLELLKRRVFLIGRATP